MTNKLIIEGKEIPLSNETVNNIKKVINLNQEVIIKHPDEIANVLTYKLMGEISWQNIPPVKITEKADRKIYVNQHFAEGSIFGRYCIFVKCKFNAHCEFGARCEFGAGC